jgi:lysozyme family protein
MKAHFKPCMVRLLEAEGVYSFDPNDTGGETCYGVTRNHYPKWPGWTIIDEYKAIPGITRLKMRPMLEADISLRTHVYDFYKQYYWDKFDLDSCESEDLCHEVFDQAVNLGVGKVCKHLQQSMNAFNYNSHFGNDVAVDGAVGPRTSARLQVFGASDTYSDLLVRALDSLQGAHYIALGNTKTTRSDYRKYMKGWFANRIRGVVHCEDRDS